MSDDDQKKLAKEAAEWRAKKQDDVEDERLARDARAFSHGKKRHERALKENTLTGERPSEIIVSDIHGKDWVVYAIFAGTARHEIARGNGNRALRKVLQPFKAAGIPITGGAARGPSA